MIICTEYGFSFLKILSYSILSYQNALNCFIKSIYSRGWPFLFSLISLYYCRCPINSLMNFFLLSQMVSLRWTIFSFLFPPCIPFFIKVTKLKGSILFYFSSSLSISRLASWRNGLYVADIYILDPYHRCSITIYCINKWANFWK